MGLAKDDCSSLLDRKAGQTVVCAVLISTNPPTIKDNTGSYCLSSALPSDVIAEEGDSCLFLFECSVQPPRCLRVTAIPHELVPVMKYQLAKFREFHQKSS
ncbi:hypothetical protein KIN20_022024 [Parelaphostrongylus tenuis]|uniref:Uncharacterized protein n=1 Tax=Parelaphostrongylus tenuis TaxID=148309 RepID=A0AAD5QWJ2_PARTN|nr:hypothetical protein KIN20_022024 [Parelaphostrongylus tenuis]